MAAHDPARVRRFLLALAAATLLLWSLGDARLRWTTLASVDADAAAVPALEAGDAHRWATVRAPLPAAAARALDAGTAVYVLASGTVARAEPGPDASSATTTGAPPPYHALVALRLLDASGEILDWRSVAVAHVGEARGRRALAFAVPTATRHVEHVLVVRGGGRWRLVRARASFVVHPPAYPAALAAVLAALAALGLLLVVRCARRAGAAATLAVAAAVGAIVVGVGLSEDAPWPGVRWVFDHSLAHLGLEAGPSLPALYAAGHALGFALVTALALGTRRRLGASAAQTLAFVALVALASEALQRHLVDRSASLLDLGLDAAGAATVLLAWWGWRRARRFRRAVTTWRPRSGDARQPIP